METEKQVWQKTGEELLRELNCTVAGLTSAEAAERQKRCGLNELHTAGRKSALKIFLEQFSDFLVLILLLAAGTSAVLGDAESAVVILAVVVLNAVLGMVQTVKAASSLEHLRQMAAPAAKVLRDGAVVQLRGKDVTVGDVVLLEAGDSVCADGRLLEAAALKCAESALTGESVPVEKDPAPIARQAALGDRRNMVFSGSFVTYGRARFLVTAVGMETEMGRIATLLKETEEKKTPLQESLDRFGKRLSVGILVICALLFVVRVFWRQEDVMDAFLFSVALAVAAIPEALSSIVTIVLALGTQRMARENAVIRKLQAVEGLGSVSVICSDKTGTLTQNRMTVQKFWAGGAVADAEGSLDLNARRLLQAALLCSDATVNGHEEVGDPTETALVRWGSSCGMEAEQVRQQWPRLGELPFDSDRKLMSTLHRLEKGLTLVTKGAVDVLLTRCEITAEERAQVEEINQRFAEEGLRVLAFACKPMERERVEAADETGLTFLGLAAMMDPPREESRQAVAACVAAGIRPVMITGDHKVTAAAIARKIGILTHGSEAVEGAVLDSMSDEELRQFVPRVSVYARVSPAHKIRIVRAWQQRGNLVAMTGDGVNDAPALKQADIGVAMGITGTEVAKDAAGMVLADDNFATIVQAVNNGRNVYANIKRAIRFLLSGNTAGLLTILYAALLGLPVPFAAVHLLFINLLTDSLPAIALGLEPHSDAVMLQQPRLRGEGILTGEFLRGMALEGLVLAAASVVSFHVGLGEGGPAVGSTMAFATLCFGRLLHGFSCKSADPVLLSRRLWNNRVLLLAFVVGTALLAAVLLAPALRGLLQTVALTGRQLGIAAGSAFASLLTIQLLKGIRKRA